MSRVALLSFAVGALALSGCATVPKALVGNYTPVSLAEAQAGTGGTTQVRWGGTIIKTEPREQQTCFFVLAEPLNSQARPKAGADSTGRFVACKSGFFDPEVYRKGRELTVTGTLAGTTQHKIGEYDYTYAKVNADSVYLWPRPASHFADSFRPATPYYDPFYWGGPWGAWGYMPYGYYRSPVIVVRPPVVVPPKKK